MRRRKVEEVLENRDNREYKLRLVCDHVVVRRGSGGRKAPASTSFDACQMVLDWRLCQP